MIGNKLEPFKFWCQKVLPNVYDDSLSYYEYLCKMNDYLNDVIEQINTLTDNMSDYETDLTAQWTTYRDELSAQWQTYKTYIDTYFDNLDVQQEINNKLDAMATDGTLSDLIEPFIGSDIQSTVTAWLNEHVDPVGSAVIVDNTLSVSGAAADSETVGLRGLLNGAYITPNNYSSLLPDLNNAVANRVYHFYYQDNESDINNLPDNFPEISKCGTVMTLICTKPTDNSGMDVQILFTQWQVFYRRKASSSAWGAWFNLVDKLTHQFDYDNTIIMANTVRANNYETVLPDLDNALTNKLYQFDYSASSTSLPLHYPTSTAYAPFSELLTLKGTISTLPTQLFWNEKGIWFRRMADATNWGNWVRLVDTEYPPIVNGNTITAQNYLTKMPSLNDANAFMANTFRIADGSSVLPNNYPTAKQKGIFTQLLTLKSNDEDYKIQLFFNKNGLWFRTNFTTTTWTNWEKIGNNKGYPNCYDVIIGSDGDFTTLKAGLEYAQTLNGAKVLVKDGVYDLISEFGDSYFENLSNVSSGLHLSNNIDITFSPNAFVTCEYEGENENVYKYFSPFLIDNESDGDITIRGLKLTSKDTRYAIHDDMSGANKNGTHTYEDCYIVHSTVNGAYSNCIGGGLGKSTNIVIKDCYFKSNSGTNNGIVSWHGSLNADTCGSIVISGCYFDSSRDDTQGGNFRYGWYGPSTKNTIIKVSNCSFKNAIVMRQEKQDVTYPENAILYDFNNTIRT